MQILFYFIKLLFVVFLLYSFPIWFSIPLICVLYHLFHHIFIPKFLNYEPLTLVDSFMFYETELNRTHWGAIDVYDKIEYSKLYEIRLNLIKKYAKLRKNIVSFLGCYYFRDISVQQAEKAIQKVSGIHTKEEIIDFCNKNFHTAFPKEGPLWKLFIIDDYSPTQTVQICILHHCLYDGLAGVFLTWLQGEEDVSMLPNFRPISLKEKIFLTLGLIYTLPKAILKIAMKKPERNPINNGKPLTGIKKMAYYDDIPFEKIKESYKKSGATLNDYFLGVLSKSVKEYFKLKDPSKDYKSINIGFPINLREKYPKTHQEVLLENNITAADLTLPLIEDTSQETKKISRVINQMKNSGEYYANKFFLIFGVFLMPKFVMCKVNMFITSKTTLCISNVPFFKKPLVVKGTNSSIQMEIGFLNNNSDIGVALAILTYGEKISISIVADTARLPEPDELATIFRKNLINC